MYTTPLNPAVARAEPRTSSLAILAVLGMIAGNQAFALSTDRDKDLEVRANYNQLVTTAPSHALFKNNVRIEQGSLKASGNEARVYDAEESGKSGRRIVLTGSPAQLEQMQDNNGGLMRARANTIDYNDGTGIAVLTGDVVVVQEGKSEFRGQQFTYNTQSGAMQGGSDAPGSEVHMTFKPKPRQTSKPGTEPKP